MAQLGLDTEFMDDFARLEKPVRDLVIATFKKFAEHTHAGIHLEKVTRCKDDRIRTIRIDQSWRGVVFAPETGDKYCLLKVLPHEKAYQYAASHKWSVNHTLGFVEVRDVAAIEQIQPALVQAATITDSRLFAGVSDQ